MSMSTEMRDFFRAVENKLGFRFACKLHEAMLSCSDKEQTQRLVRLAIVCTGHYRAAV